MVGELGEKDLSGTEANFATSRAQRLRGRRRVGPKHPPGANGTGCGWPRQESVRPCNVGQ